MPPGICFPPEQLLLNPIHHARPLPVPEGLPAVPLPPIALRDKACRWAEMQLGLVSTSGKGRAAPRSEGRVFVSSFCTCTQEFQCVRLIVTLGYRMSGTSEIVLKLQLHLCLIKLDWKLLKGRGQIYFCSGLQCLEQGLAPWKVLPNTCQPEWPSETLSFLVFSTQSPP